MKRTPPADPAQLVQRARAALKLSQQDFGVSVGKSQGLISKYETGHVVPPAHVVIHCVNVLGEAALSEGNAPKGWDAVHVALAQLQQALAQVTPAPRQSQRMT